MVCFREERGGGGEGGTKEREREREREREQSKGNGGGGTETEKAVRRQKVKRGLIAKTDLTTDGDRERINGAPGGKTGYRFAFARNDVTRSIPHRLCWK